MEFTARILSHKMDALHEALAEVNRKAEKFGAEPLTLEVSDLISETSPSGEVTLYHDVSIIGKLPKISGWSLIARIDHTGPRNIIVSTGETDNLIDPKWRDAKPVCDHCEYMRNRHDTFLLVNDADEWKQVGRNCLSDFAGNTNPVYILGMFVEFEERLRDLEADEKSGSIASPFINTITYLSNVSAMIAEHGWYSKTAFRNNEFRGLPTADRAMNNMFPPSVWNEEDLAIISEENLNEANAAFAWVRNLDGSELNDYEYNLVALTEEDYFNYRRYSGIVASIIQAYRRASGLNEQGEKREIVSTHQGELKERLKDLTLTLVRRTDIEIASYSGNGYDMLKIHNFEDEAGNVYVWKTTTKKLWEGDTYIVTGTVKKHDEFNNVPQTILTRCKVKCPTCGKDPRDDKLWESSITKVNLYAIDECWHCYLEKTEE
jgi:hypothetical protein